MALKMSSWEGVGIEITDARKQELIHEMAQYLLENPETTFVHVGAGNSMMCITQREDPVFGTKWFHIFECSVRAQGSALTIQELLDTTQPKDSNKDPRHCSSPHNDQFNKPTEKAYNIAEIKKAFWNAFHRCGNIFFDNLGNNKHCDECTEGAWQRLESKMTGD